MVERFRLKTILSCLVFFSSICSDVYSQESIKQYYIEKIVLATTPVRSCIYKAFKDKKIIEDCTSLGFKLGTAEDSSNSIRYIFLHPLSKEEIASVELVWTMFHLENDLLVSTKLRSPKEERLVSDGMLSVLEGEEGILETRAKGVDIKLVELNRQLDGYLTSDAASDVVRKIYAQYEKKREEDLSLLLKSGLDAEQARVSPSIYEKDIRGYLSDQLRDIMEGRVR